MHHSPLIKGWKFPDFSWKDFHSADSCKMVLPKIYNFIRKLSANQSQLNHLLTSGEAFTTAGLLRVAEEAADFDLLGFSRSSFRSSLTNALKKYMLTFFPSWLRTNQSPRLDFDRINTIDFLKVKLHLTPLEFLMAKRTNRTNFVSLSAEFPKLLTNIANRTLSKRMVLNL